MNAVFADTSFYVAVTSEVDAHHAASIGLAQAFRGMIVTTDFVLVEVGNWFCKSGDRAVFVRLMQQLLADPRTKVVLATRELFDAGRDLYADRRDKDWSLTDCISFVVMDEERLTEALTADHHFQQAGFTILLK